MESKHKSTSQTKQINIKTNTNLNHQRLHKITTVFRFMEMIIFLFMISSFSSQIPSAVKLAGDYLRGSSFTVFSPKFVFVIGNLIILILFLRSRAVEYSDEIGNDDLCYEYVKSCDRIVVDARMSVGGGKERRICRSKSENPISVKCGDGGTRRELRRSVTEIGRLKDSGDGGKAAKEELSSEDFRQTVEAFIARQQKILRDEEFSPMVCVY